MALPPAEPVTEPGAVSPGTAGRSSAVDGGASPSAAHQSAAPGSSTSRCSTSYLTSALHLSHVTVNSAVLNTTGSYTPPPPWPPTPITGLPSFCAVALIQTDSAGNPIHITVWLPTKWNGRCQGIGGGGYACGIFYAPGPGYVSASLEETLKGGYASAATDCGVPTADGNTGRWALKPDGQLNKPLINDFASAGIHDMTVAGKAVTQAFYPDKIQYSYFNRCSTGGREVAGDVAGSCDGGESRAQQVDLVGVQPGEGVLGAHADHIQLDLAAGKIPRQPAATLPTRPLRCRAAGWAAGISQAADCSVRRMSASTSSSGVAAATSCWRVSAESNSAGRSVM
jgi:hypothetical protein